MKPWCLILIRRGNLARSREAAKGAKGEEDWLSKREKL